MNTSLRTPGIVTVTDPLSKKMASTAVHLPSINGSSASPSKPKSAPQNQIYEGHKFYWKQRLNVDLNFLYHKENKSYEIISYDTDKDVELKSLFLSEDVLMTLVGTDVEEAVAKMKQENARDRFKQAPPDAEVRTKAKHASVTQFILARLVAFVENGNPGLRLNPLSGTHTPLCRLYHTTHTSTHTKIEHYHSPYEINTPYHHCNLTPPPPPLL